MELSNTSMFVEFKCPLCNRDLDDDKNMANFMVCKNESHGLLRFYTGDGCYLRFYTGDGCYFTTDEKAAEELMKKGRRVHVVDPQEFFAKD